MTDPMNFWVQLLTDPKSFFQTHLKENKIKNFYIAMVVFCLGYGIDRVDRQLVKLEIRGTLDSIEFINTWPGYWLISAAGGAIGGIILYLIAGWFYNVRVKWSKGTGNLDHSRSLYLFSNFYLYFVIIVITIVSTIINPIPYDPYAELNSFDAISLILVLFFIFYSIYISFSGVTATTDVEKGRATIWFLVLPIIFYILAFATVFILLVNYFRY